MKENLSLKKSVLSISIIIASLFVLVFVKMEVRKQGYVLYKLSKKYKKMKDQNRLLSIKLAKKLRPERVRGLILNQTSDKYIRSGKIIQMTAKGAVLTTK